MSRRATADAKETPKRAAARHAAQRSLTAYGVMIEPIPKWKPYGFHRELARALEWLERTPDARLIVQAPPRVGKTVEGSNLLSPWFLGKHSDQDVMAVTYAGDRAKDIGHRVKQILTSPRHRFVFPRAVPSEQDPAATRIELAGGGSYRGLSFKGSATGRGANLLSIDDPNKGPDQARSALWQNQIREDWRYVFRPRVNPGGKILVSMARYGIDDFVGWLLKEDTEDWRVLTCPMLDANDNPLVPELFDREACERLRASVGSRVWESLYQQNPAPDDAPIFKRSWWKFYGTEHGKQLPTRFDDLIMMWDCKLKDLATSGSFVCGQAWGRLGTDLYLLAVVRERWNFTQTVEQMEKLYVRFPAASALCIEDAAAGPVAIQVLRKKFSNVIAIPATGSKNARAEAVAPVIEAGSVYLPLDSWVEAFIEECATFPTGAYDDQVDAMSHAIARLTLGQVDAPPVGVGVVGQSSVWSGA